MTYMDSQIQVADTSAGSLSSSQTWYFRHCGYLLLSGILTPEEVDRLRAGGLRQIVSADSAIETDAEGNVIKVSAFMQRDPSLVEVLRNSKLVDALESLLGPTVELLLNRHNHLTIGKGAERAQRLHRDVLQWSRTIISTIIHLDDEGDGGSATRVVPGSHLLPFAERPNNGGTWMDEQGFLADLMSQEVPIPSKPGDVLVMDGVLFHGAGRSSEADRRLCLTLGFRAPDELDEREIDPGAAVLIRGERRYRGQPPLQ